ncbi:hypothetical protein I3271_00955 [Photobacterium leiognathi]|uniref:hypothetical protein n=1 Tax=Photobacterium leiognathi TaxID=553611 RepID=UPI001EDFA85A|nr:hypothetical protein [Photobacterium leiognathi]MCG3883251.1 hypothetical protein [Photobacterium leiognathi]
MMNEAKITHVYNTSYWAELSETHARIMIMHEINEDSRPLCYCEVANCTNQYDYLSLAKQLMHEVTDQYDLKQAKNRDKPVQINNITNVWAEDDFFGNKYIVISDGERSETIITLRYNYAFTCNGVINNLARKLAIQLGATEPVDFRTRKLEL